ncbi:MAG: type II toxin-antitoxin system Phd/YefM family antitoxin [Acidobacteria bacterium]|nr:type II toxin-antitoxin system Phd/YefM family antitoxin [Acidobacteriota bacterium]
MRTPRLDEDIRPVTEFRARAAALIEQVRRTKRALVLTQHGQSAAVLIDVGEYQRLLDELELLRDVRVAEGQLAAGQGVSQEEARERVLKALRR